MELGHESWSDQFVQAMNVNGGEVEEATGFDYVMHFLTFGFKTIFAIIPPPSIGGGWPCFVGALLFIGLFTMIISDLANIFERVQNKDLDMFLWCSKILIWLKFKNKNKKNDKFSDSGGKLLLLILW